MCREVPEKAKKREAQARRPNHFLAFCWPLVASGGQNCAKGFVMASFYSHFGSNLTHIYKKMWFPVGQKSKHIQENFGAFWKLAGVPFCFSLNFVVDFVCRVRPTREGMFPRSAGSRRGNTYHKADYNGEADCTQPRASTECGTVAGLPKAIG